jgi:hypothetical protein
VDRGTTRNIRTVLDIKILLFVKRSSGNTANRQAPALQIALSVTLAAFQGETVLILSRHEEAWPSTTSDKPSTPHRTAPSFRRSRRIRMGRRGEKGRVKISPCSS